MPTDIINLTGSNRGVAGATANDAAGTPSSTWTSPGLYCARDFNVPGHLDHDNETLICRFPISTPAGATSIVYKLRADVSSKDDLDNRSLTIDLKTGFHPPVTGSMAVMAAYPGDCYLTDITGLSIGSQDLTLSSVSTYNDPVSGGTWVALVLGISGTGTSGLNKVSFASLQLVVSYSHSATPTGLTLDGDSANGITIDRTVSHRFAWSTGQVSTRFKLSYKRTSDVSWTVIDQTTPNQYWDAPSGTFTSGADNSWQWKVQSYNDEPAASAESAVKTFTAVAALAAPTVAPTGTVTSALLTITLSSAATHTKEQYRIYESGVLIYNTGELVQTSNTHIMSSGYFLNGKTGLENGHSYTIKGKIIDSSNQQGEGTASITVVFTPPSEAVLTAVNERGYINLNYQNPAGGATPTSVDLLYSQAYDAILNPTGYDPVLNEDGVFSALVSGLVPSTDTDDPNYKWYETKHGQEYYVRARVWAGEAYIDSELVPVVGSIPLWVSIHDPDDGEGTIEELDGWVSPAGRSDYAMSWQPKLAYASFLNAQHASVDRELTSAGLPVGVELWDVTVILLARTLEEQEKRDRVERLLRLGKRLCVRTKDNPLGRLIFGSVVSLSPPRPLNEVMNQYELKFQFVQTA